MTVERAHALADRGRALLDEYDAHAESERGARALSDALAAFRAARALLEEAGPASAPEDLAVTRFLLGVTLSVRYWQAHGTTDLAEDEAFRHGALAERAEAAELLALALALFDPDRPERTEAAFRLGLLLHVRHEEAAGGEVPDEAARPDDLDRAIEALGIACPDPVPRGPWSPLGEESPDEAPRLGPDERRATVVATLGCALADRYDRDGAGSDLAAAMGVLEGMLGAFHPFFRSEPGGPYTRPAPDEAAGPADSVELAARERLVTLLLEAAERAGGEEAGAGGAGVDAAGAGGAAGERLEHSERAVQHLELLVATTGPDDPVRLRAALRLVDAYLVRGGGTVRPEDADHRFARLLDLRRLLPPEHPLGGTARWLLGSTLAQRGGLDRGVVSAEAREAVVVLREGLAGMAADEPVRAASHAVLGSVLNALRPYEPETYRAEEAHHHLSRAVELMRSEEEYGIVRSDVLNQLAHAEIVQGEFATDQAEVDRVIDLIGESQARPSTTQGFDQHVHGAMAAAMAKRFTLTNAPDDLDAAIRSQRAAFRAAAPDDINRLVYLQNLATSLQQRFQLGGDHQDVEAALHYHDEILAFLDGPGREIAGIELVLRERPMYERARLMLEFQIALGARDIATMGRVVEQLEPMVMAIAADDPLQLLALGDFGAAAAIYSLFTGDVDRRVRAVGLMVEAAENTPAGHLHKPVLTMRAASALSTLALEPVFSEHRAESALRYIEEFLATADPGGLEGLRGRLMRATLLLTRYRHARRPADAAAVVADARMVRERLRHGAPTQVLAAVSALLADAHRERLGPGDRALSRELGLAALRETAAATLLQAAADSALTVARDTAARALLIARWCLADLEDGQAAGDGRDSGDGRGAGGERDSSDGRDDGPAPYLPAAVEALELGRGLVLHASTATTDVPDLLRAAGHPDLADAWQSGGRSGAAAPAADGDPFAAVLGLPAAGFDGAPAPEPGMLLGSLPDGAGVPMPDDLRRRALTALAGSPVGAALMAPPPVEEIARSLRTAGADALVYLLPPGAGRSGEAVLVTAAGGVELQRLTLVRSDALGLLTAYRQAHRDRQATLDADLPKRHPDRVAALRRWQAALAELCDWAGTAVVRPLLRHPALRAAAGPQPRLVLVPFGEFGGVPWHAALLSSGLRDGGRPVRAVERAVLSYAASARQFCEVAGRPRLPLGERPVIVGDPARDLLFADVEAEYLHEVHYPHGTLLGYVEGAEGEGTPREVLAALPAPGRAGASVLHLACHAMPSGRSPLDAYLVLAPEPGPESASGPGAGPGRAQRGRLPVGDILRQAQGRPPGAPGGLVVLDACVSDLTAGDLDEALTLSTAFLAAGATGVVGSRWEVNDAMVGLLMYVLHARLTAGDPPVEALRRTQLWALDPDRRLPAGTPAELAALVRGDPGRLDVWAAFGYQGS